jgi:hypothetical protein
VLASVAAISRELPKRLRRLTAVYGGVLASGGTRELGAKDRGIILQGTPAKLP